MKADPLDNVFQALASASRRAILDILTAKPGCSVAHICSFFDVSRIAIMKHLRVLEDAGLLISEKRGRTRQLYFNPSPIQSIHERWTTQYSALWASRLNEFKQLVEDSQISAKEQDDEPKTEARSRKNHAGQHSG